MQVRNDFARIPVIATALLMFGLPPLSSGQALGQPARCGQFLDAARQAVGTAQEQADPQAATEKGVRLYEQAFAACGDWRRLPLELGARVAAERGEFLLDYRQEPRAAVEVFEAALRWTGENGGLNHPSRVPLLQGLARAIRREAELHGDEVANVRAIRREKEIFEQALAVREAAYGAESLEAVEGHLLLATAYLDEQPVLAEEIARRALEIARARVGNIHRAVWSALVTLHTALLRQGRLDEAEEVLESSAEISYRLEERGDPDADDRDSWFVTPHH